jgi:hypothetical protein
VIDLDAFRVALNGGPDSEPGGLNLDLIMRQGRRVRRRRRVLAGGAVTGVAASVLWGLLVLAKPAPPAPGPAVPPIVTTPTPATPRPTTAPTASPALAPSPTTAATPQPLPGDGTACPALTGSSPPLGATPQSGPGSENPPGSAGTATPTPRPRINHCP